MTNRPWKGRGMVTWIILIFWCTNHISGTAEARVVKFCTQVLYVKSQHTDNKRWQITIKKGVVRVTWPALNLGPGDISRTVWARIVKFCAQVECIKSEPMDGKPKRSVVKVTWPIFNFNFDARNHISVTAEARVAKFCMQITSLSHWPFTSVYSTVGVRHASRGPVSGCETCTIRYDTIGGGATIYWRAEKNWRMASLICARNQTKTEKNWRRLRQRKQP